MLCNVKRQAQPCSISHFRKLQYSLPFFWLSTHLLILPGQSSLSHYRMGIATSAWFRATGSVHHNTSHSDCTCSIRWRKMTPRKIVSWLFASVPLRDSSVASYQEWWAVEHELTCFEKQHRLFLSVIIPEGYNSMTTVRVRKPSTTTFCHDTSSWHNTKYSFLSASGKKLGRRRWTRATRTGLVVSMVYIFNSWGSSVYGVRLYGLCVTPIFWTYVHQLVSVALYLFQWLTAVHWEN